MCFLNELIECYSECKYSVCVIGSMTLLERLIKGNEATNKQKKLMEILSSITEREIFGTEKTKIFIKEKIYSQCYSKEEVNDAFPGRNGGTHGWKLKYTHKHALMYFMLIDFMLFNQKELK